MSSQEHFRFTLTKRQVNDLEDNLLLDGARFVHLGVEQPDSTFQFDLSHEDLEELRDGIAAACHDADDEHTEARLDTIYKKLAKVLEG
jgi:hypothetical protein